MASVPSSLYIAGVSERRGKLSNKRASWDLCSGHSDYNFSSSNKSQSPRYRSGSKLANCEKFCAHAIPGKCPDTSSRTMSKDESRPDYSSLKRKGANLCISPTKTRRPPWNILQNADSAPDVILHRIDSLLEVDGVGGSDISSVASTTHGHSCSIESNSTVSFNTSQYDLRVLPKVAILQYSFDLECVGASALI